MKIIILAAGTGSRLGPITNNTPKPLIDLGYGKTLLETQMENIIGSKVIEEIILVTGYCADQIDAKIKKYQQEGVNIRTIYNPFYEVSNNLMSLWMAKSEMTGDFLITNGDNIFEPSVFKQLIEKGSKGIHLTITNKNKYYEDDMKVILDGHLVDQVSKTLSNESANAESVGLALVSGEKYREIFKDNLEALARDKRYIGKFWLEIFNRMSHHGVPINTFEIEGKSNWLEIDFHGDLNEVIRNLFIRKMTSLSKEDADSISKDLMNLNNPKIQTEEVIKILDVLPQKHDEVNHLFTKDSLSSEEVDAVLKIVKRYSNQQI